MEGDIMNTTNNIQDLSEIIGQEHAKRVLEVAAVCGANVLFVGTPGGGKGMLSEAYAGLLGIDPENILRVSVSDTVKTLGKKLQDQKGNDTLLIADGLPELKRDVLVFLKEISQDIPVVASMSPCPCGYLADPRHQCTCTPAQITRYRSNLSGSLLDIFDIHVEVPPVAVRDLCNAINGTQYMQETTENVLKRVIPARELYGLNQDNTKPHQDALDLLATASLKLGFSAKAIKRIMKVGRAIADLDHEDIIKSQHIAEAVQYRVLDRRT
jgi:magnesium chelatase family protein